MFSIQFSTQIEMFIFELIMLRFARSPSLAWLERPADNREVLSSNLKGTTHLITSKSDLRDL